MKVLKIILLTLFFIGCQPISSYQRVHFIAVGDHLLHSSVLEWADRMKGTSQDGEYDFSSLYQHVSSYIQEADLAFVNQETILGGDNLKITGYPLFNSPYVVAKNLHDIGFNIINGATNHALDQGFSGVCHSIHAFQQYPDIKYIGLHETKEDKDDIPIIVKKGIRFALLSYNQWSNVDLPNDYCINTFDKQHIQKDVQKAQENSDFIIVSCHWGEEYEKEANDFQKEYAQFLTDLGVDVIIGTHSHTLQEVQWLQGKKQTLVAYSLGNFISGMMEEETQLGGMLSLDFVKDNQGCHIENTTLIPLINHYTAQAYDVYQTRDHFTVYPLKDYHQNLASQHGLNGYQNIVIDIERMKAMVKQKVQASITIFM